MIASPSGWDAMLQRMAAMPDGGIRRLADEMDEKRKEAPKEYSGIVGSIYEAIEALSIPAIRETLSGSDFSLEVLCQRDCNVYLVIPAEYLGLLAPVQRAIFGTAILYKNRHPSAPGVLLMVDEAAQLGNFEALLRAYSYGRGMGLRTWSFWQDPGQTLPAITARLRSPASSAPVSAVSSLACAISIPRDWFRRCSPRTLEFDSVLEQDSARRNYASVVDALMKGCDPFAAGLSLAQFKSAAQHSTKQARALLTPDEVLNLPEHQQILFVSGLDLAPVLAHKRPYFTRPEMAGGYLPNPYHPPAHCVPVAGQLRTSAPVVTERVPAHLAHWPQYQSGKWSYIQGFRPV